MKNYALKKTLKKNRLIEKLGYIIRIVCACIAMPALKMKAKQASKKVWLIGLGDDIYANNGKVFFEYIKEKHTDIDIYWVCEKKSKKELAKYISSEKLLSRGSIRNYCMVIIAEVAIYGFSDFDVAPGYFRLIKDHSTVLVNISHGYDGLKGMPPDYYEKMPADIICAASSYEKRIKIEQCGAEEEKVFLTGFARYDQWKVDSGYKKQIKHILIMPTWRDWYEEERLDWKKTPMYIVYSSVLKRLDQMAEKYKFHVVFHFHPRMRAFFSAAGWDHYNNITASEEKDTIQNLLTEADMVVSDYSSIFWDAVYMNKRVILFWFDEKEYEQKRGLMRTELVLAQTVKTEEALFTFLEEQLNGTQRQCEIRKAYFDWQDQNNCERIFKAIQTKTSSGKRKR